MENKHLAVLPVVFILFFFVVIVSCSQKRETADLTKVKIGIGAGGLAYPFVVAKEKGFFIEAGLDCELVSFAFGKKALDAMLNNELNIASVTELPLVKASFSRNDFSIYATYAYSYDNIKVLGLKEEGVINPQDLKGKKIGTIFGTSAHFYTYIYLIEHSIAENECEIVNILPKDFSSAIKEKKVQAVITFEPFAYQLQNEYKDTIVRLPSCTLYYETFNLTVMRSYAEDNPEILEKTIIALEKALLFMSEKPAETSEIIAIKTNTDALFYETTKKDITFEVTLDSFLLSIFDDEARWIIKNGMTDKEKHPDYLQYFHIKTLKKMKPDHINIIK